jgi:hypothetical protein
VCDQRVSHNGDLVGIANYSAATQRDDISPASQPVVARENHPLITGWRHVPSVVRVLRRDPCRSKQRTRTSIQAKSDNEGCVRLIVRAPSHDDWNRRACPTPRAWILAFITAGSGAFWAANTRVLLNRAGTKVAGTYVVFSLCVAAREGTVEIDAAVVKGSGEVDRIRVVGGDEVRAW